MKHRARFDDPNILEVDAYGKITKYRKQKVVVTKTRGCGKYDCCVIDPRKKCDVNQYLVLTRKPFEWEGLPLVWPIRLHTNLYDAPDFPADKLELLGKSADHQKSKAGRHKKWDESNPVIAAVLRDMREQKAKGKSYGQIAQSIKLSPEAQHALGFEKLTKDRIRHAFEDCLPFKPATVAAVILPKNFVHK